MAVAATLPGASQEFAGKSARMWAGALTWTPGLQDTAGRDFMLLRK